MELLELLEILSESDPIPKDVNTKIPYFIISTIAVVPDIDNFDNEESSDEELDCTIDEIKFKAQSYYIQKTIKKQQFKDENVNNEAKKNQIACKSVVVEPFLRKLSEQAFEIPMNTDKNKNTIVVSLALNKMLSVSTRKNCALQFELDAKSKSNFQHKKFGFFWECQWYTTNKEKGSKHKKVNFEKVKKIYKQLKRHDPKMAKKFLEQEREVLVPFQQLREYAKNHAKTKELVKYMRSKYNRNITIYFTLMDSDTYNFNGVFSAYRRIVQKFYEKHQNLPTIMSTGYEYCSTDESWGHMFKIASRIDRNIRIVTSKHLPLSVYYPEPNMCILIPDNEVTLPEEFFFRKRNMGNFESPNIINNILTNRLGELNFEFSDDVPLITNVPERAKYTKVHHKKLLKFSSFSPTKEDFLNMKQISQCSQHRKVWYDNLFINFGIQFINKLEKHVKAENLDKCKLLLKEVKRKTANDNIKKMPQCN